jgi:hypothetical protein
MALDVLLREIGLGDLALRVQHRMQHELLLGGRLVGAYKRLPACEVHLPGDRIDGRGA